jgi:hypothetical protein
MDRRRFLQGTGLLVAAGSATQTAAAVANTSQSGVESRRQWLDLLQKTADPVLTALSERRLKQVMPVECKPGQEASRRQCTYLEALGRSLSGIAPWLEAGSETALRQRYCELSREAIAAGVDPSSPDYMPFGVIAQTLVDAAFLGLGILRAPKQLGEQLPAKTKAHLIEGLKKTRTIQPPVSNWLLFAAVVEATLEHLGADWDHAPVELALAKHKEWYVGDGVYGDGPHFHADYYDSYVIHPFLLAVLNSPVGKVGVGPELAAIEPTRAVRYAAIQERMIARDGTWPVTGRSITYRCGAFHLLADRALHEQLPEGVDPAQVRGALSAAMNASLGAAGSFDRNGWLTIGLGGHQPSLGETYISTGSLYLCLNAFLPLGLPAEKTFWSSLSAPWTAQKAWSGADIAADHAIAE